MTSIAKAVGYQSRDDHEARLTKYGGCGLADLSGDISVSVSSFHRQHITLRRSDEGGPPCGAG